MLDGYAYTEDGISEINDKSPHPELTCCMFVCWRFLFNLDTFETSLHLPLASSSSSLLSSSSHIFTFQSPWFSLCELVPYQQYQASLCIIPSSNLHLAKVFPRVVARLGREYRLTQRCHRSWPCDVVPGRVHCFQTGMK